ncbi:uncharacterized protein [Dysidea avara]|uniref:uncharacterized protein isoform X2 n=1 Tax=Dysidea avara TaxID=196820 RepID=UPI003322F99E
MFIQLWLPPVIIIFLQGREYISNTARRKIRRSEESIITLQQERQELLEKNVKSEKLIQSLQVHLPKAELLLHDADDKIAAAKQSVTAAKEMLLEYSMKESSSDRGTTISAATMSEELNVEQCLPFNPVMASTPQHSPISSPTRVKEDVNIHDNVVGGSFDMVNITDQLQHSPDLSEVDMLSVLSPLQDVPSISPIIEAEKGPSFKASKTIKPMIGRTPRPKRHCTELATSYAEDDLMRKLYGEELSDDIPAAKQKKSKNVLKKKPALSNITNVISTQ